MSVKEKLTAIADAIRVFTGETAKLGLDAIKQGIYEVHDDGYNKGYIDGIPHGRETGYSDGYADGAASKLFEVHKITIANDLTTESATWLLTNNKFVTDHWDKEGFMIQLIPLFGITEGYGIFYAFNSNRTLATTSDMCGGALYLNPSGAMSVAKAVTSCSKGNYGGVPFVGSARTGIAVINNNNVGTIKAGDYLLVLSVAEV